MLAHTLKALVSIYNAVKFKVGKELVPNLLPILKIKFDLVLTHVLSFLNTICKNVPLEFSKISLHE